MGISQSRLREIMAQHAGPLTLYARQFLDGHTAEDVVQEAFFRLSCEQTDSENPIENPVAWLYRAVRNGAISQKRSDMRRAKRENAKRHEPWFESDPANRLDAELVAETLQALSPELREIVTLHVWGELSFAEIAELLGTSKATAFRRYEEGLTALRQLLGGHRHEEQ
jgi:RNA polymerase sigma-70 factor (ECF subfamily)